MNSSRSSGSGTKATPDPELAVPLAHATAGSDGARRPNHSLVLAGLSLFIVLSALLSTPRSIYGLGILLGTVVAAVASYVGAIARVTWPGLLAFLFPSALLVVCAFGQWLGDSPEVQSGYSFVALVVMSSSVVLLIALRGSTGRFAIDVSPRVRVIADWAQLYGLVAVLACGAAFWAKSTEPPLKALWHAIGL